MGSICNRLVLVMWKKLFGIICLVAVGIVPAIGNPCSSISGAIYHRRSGFYDDFCYWPITSKQNGESSQTLCEGNGGILATIPDKESDAVTQQIMLSNGFVSCYIGLQDDNHNQVYKTYDDQLQWYTNWQINNPDNRADFGCVKAKKIYSPTTFQFLEYQWTDVACFETLNALCSKAIKKDKDFPSTTYQEWSETYYYGNKIATISSQSIIQCAAICQQTTDCFSFSFNLAALECILYNNDVVIFGKPSQLKFFRLLS